MIMINEYRNALRDLIQRLNNKGQANQVIVWQVLLDESLDASLLSQRAYGSRDFVDVVMVACGVNGIWEQLPLTKILLPQARLVLELRKRYGVTNG